jgi:hypothetical protein
MAAMHPSIVLLHRVLTQLDLSPLMEPRLPEDAVARSACTDSHVSDSTASWNEAVKKKSNWGHVLFPGYFGKRGRHKTSCLL